MTDSTSQMGSSPLLWKGLLTDAELDRILLKLGDFIVCPGYTGHYGSSVDAWGRLRVPGSTNESSSVSLRRLRKWKIKTAEDPRYSWWPQMAAELGIEPLKLSDVLSGIQKSRWQEYHQHYNRGRWRRGRLRNQKKKYDAAHCRLEETDLPASAANALLCLTQASPERQADSTGSSTSPDAR